MSQQIEKTFAELVPLTSNFVESIERLQILTRAELETVMCRWDACVVGEAHGNSKYEQTCPQCREFAKAFGDYARLTWQRYYQYANPNSPHWKEYRLVLFNLTHQKQKTKIGESEWGGGNGYTYDDQSLNQLKADFAHHFNMEHVNKK